MSDTQTPITMSVLPPVVPMAMHMTLRDYFAAQAMQVIAGKSYDNLAKHAYLLADEMMKAREGK